MNERMKNNGKSLLLSLFGDSPKLRVLDFLITFQKFDYSLTQIAENSGVGYATLEYLWKDLVKNDMIIQTRVVGKAKMFRANMENSAVQLTSKLQFVCARVKASKRVSPAVQ